MRLGNLILCLMLPLVVACKILPQGPDEPPPTAVGQDGASAAAVQPGDASGPASGVKPKPRPTASSAENGPSIAPAAELQPAAEIAPLQSLAQKSKDQLICEKQGGTWGSAGKSIGKTCVKRTRDSGKQCRKQDDCSSLCLARSGTCAPVEPLFGCNEIFQKDGSRATLCLD